MIDYTMIPEHCRESMKAYIEIGQPVGSFLRAVLCDSLCGAMGQADSINREHLLDYCDFLYLYAPGKCWGSHEKVEAWIAKGGLKGR